MNTDTHGLLKRYPTWLLGDHLGSTSMVADDTGNVVSEVRYSAFGEIRYDSGTMTTDYLYTGQRHEAEIGLYYYVARWYDPEIGRFVQADSMVPNPGRAIGFDRYGYAYNSPLNMVDSSGHIPEGACGFWGGDCGTEGMISSNHKLYKGPKLDNMDEKDLGLGSSSGNSNKNMIFSDYPEISFIGNWTLGEKAVLYDQLTKLYASGSSEFIDNYVANLNLRVWKLKYNYGYQLPLIGITLNTDKALYGQTFMHEVWHEIDDTSGFFYVLSGQFEEYIGSSTEHIYFGEHGLSPGMEYNPAPGWPIYGGGKPPNRREDLAESAMEYFYLEARNISKDGLRWKFLEILLTIGQPPTP